MNLKVYPYTQYGLIINQKNSENKNNNDHSTSTNYNNWWNNQFSNEILKNNITKENELNIEWNKNELLFGTEFWIKNGVSIIGCEWLEAIEIINKTVSKWNNPYCKYPFQYV